MAERDKGTRHLETLKDAIRFRRVSVVYPRALRSALDSIDLEIPAGRITGLIGPSGAGKSTLVDVLLRLVDTTSGIVTIDGAPLESFSLKSLRTSMAYMPQIPYMFDATVASNLRYMRPQATEAELEEACRRACADDFIRALPAGYDTVVGEGGIKLSVGQRQRIALARVFLSTARLLILDEPTSAVDVESEHIIHAAMRELVADRGMTVIIIAHRLSTIRDVDQLVVLQQGRVADVGHPTRLRYSDTWYRRVLGLTDDLGDTGLIANSQGVDPS